MRALFFTQQSIGLGARKTSMIFLAEAMRDRGFDVTVVTCQLSQLSRFGAAGRLDAMPVARRNRMLRADGMNAYIWVAPLHPARLAGPIDGMLGPLLMKAYAAAIPPTLKDAARAADLIVIESCAALALFRRLRRIAPRAKIVYNMSDRLLPVGMHPVLQHRMEQDAAAYDLIRMPAAAMANDFPGARAAVIRHGLDLKLFDGDAPSPYAGTSNVLMVGDMMLDRPLLGQMIARFPQAHFHYFGRTPLGLGPSPNLTEYGERPFVELVPYLQNADVGLSLYRIVPELDYLAQSSLKNIQYEYCGLPIVTPQSVANPAPNYVPYADGDVDSACDALANALARGRGPGRPADIQDWRQVAGTILDEVGL